MDLNSKFTNIRVKEFYLMPEKERISLSFSFRIQEDDCFYKADFHFRQDLFEKAVAKLYKYESEQNPRDVVRLDKETSIILFKRLSANQSLRLVTSGFPLKTLLDKNPDFNN